MMPLEEAVGDGVGGGEMNTAKIYHDIDGNECTIYQMVRRDPGWAAARIQAGEEAIAKLAAIEAGIMPIPVEAVEVVDE